ncbi:hypothetical protein IMSHALPRED_004235 [Imshaugia aleurites]|uniref:Uncharacterized protein n=1 Tax=Imshaugia aleurites TaxID=172621 RepID=A0A8H3F572_9LECA|nr:hypothetical protein IMSHALPRED_004235 [Imshaugia aleurites]
MNWTGGALSRSRNASGEVSLSAKQKNHFAKARVKLGQGQRPSLPEIQFFDFGEWKPESGAQDDQRTDRVRQTGSSQRTLDQFENVQGVVKKLKSLRPRNEGDKRKRSPINDTEGYVLPSGIPVPPISPIAISSRSRSSLSPIEAESTTKRKIKRLRTTASSTSDELYPLAALDGVEAKRRKLLEQSDWVGIERQKRNSKPVKIDFTDARDRDLIGRRRPLNGSAVQNRWNVQGSRCLNRLPMASSSEKSHRNLAEEYWSADRLSIRIGETAVNVGPLSDDLLLERDHTPGPMKCSSLSIQPFGYRNAKSIPNTQHRRHEATHPSDFREESPGPFRSLFSHEEVEESGLAQLVKAANVADDENSSLAEDELKSLEDYHYPEPRPGFRLVFEKTPQPRGQASEPSESISPIVRDFAFPEGQLPGATIEPPARLEDPNVLREQISKYPGIEDALSGTSPLSVASSRYIQELEKQSKDVASVALASAKSSAFPKPLSTPNFPWSATRPGPSPRSTEDTFVSGGQRRFAENKAKTDATARAQSAVNENEAEEKRGTITDQEAKNLLQADEVQGKDTIQPTEDEDEIWRNFVNIDESNDFQSIQEQPTGTPIPHTTTENPSMLKTQIANPASPESEPQKIPQPPPDDDELVWQRFIFSDSDPNDHEWIIEEPKRPDSPPANSTSAYNPARTQPSMVAEVATSPIKQNPHLLDEMLDASTPILDDASCYANASTSSPSIVSDSPDRYSNQATTAFPAPCNSHPYPRALPLPPRNPQLPNPSSSSASSFPLPTRSIPPPSPTGTTHKFSSESDELSWTPSRLPGPPTKEKEKEKVVFKKPSRYVGERASDDAPEPLHLGRNVDRRGMKEKTKKRSLGEAVQRAKDKMAGKVRERGSGRRDEGYGDEETGDTDRDDIVDD